MHILLTGGTGFIGKRLVAHLKNKHQLTVLSRQPAHAVQRLGFDLEFIDRLDSLDDLNEFDAVINLAGEPIAAGRWSKHRKFKICQSRWETTRKLVELALSSAHPPHVFISGSAIGYYGRQGDRLINESCDEPYPEFTHTVCKEWERLTEPLASLCRVVLIRTGVVLGCTGGALAKMKPAFRCCLGGPLGSGQQYMSWIHLDDEVRAIQFLLDHPDCQGAFNLTAPQPVTNAEFTRQLARILKRPLQLPTPAWMLKLAMGEMADLVLHGQRVIPQRLSDMGFHFQHPNLEDALKSIVLK